MHERPRASATFATEEGLKPSLLFLVFFLVLLLLFSRRPGDLLHPQFYAEDGKRWFAQAYNLHWLPSLLVPDASYLHLLARILTGPALLFPLRLAPLWMNISGAAIQALPVVALLSPRAATWGSLRNRFVMALLYIASPNTGEIHVVLTNAQWHFGLLQVLLAFSEAPRSRLGKMSDIAIFTIGAFTGPFDLVLLPILLLAWYQQRRQWTLVLAGCLALGAIFQMDTLLTGSPFGLAHSPVAQVARLGPDKQPLGANLHTFVQICGGNLFLDSLTGYIDLRHLPSITPAIFLVFGCFMVGCGLRWGPPALRYFALFALLIFAASLKSPLILVNVPKWEAIASGGAMRYCFLPMLVFVWSAVYVYSRSGNRVIKAACVLLFLLYLTGLRHWVYPPFDDHHFGQYAAQFQQDRPGDTVNIPIQPNPWFMTLTKR